MSRMCKVLGSLLAIVGIAIALSFLVAIARDHDYAAKALSASRYPDHALYQAEFAAARAVRAFQIIFASLGGLLCLNGVTVVLVGSLAGRPSRP